MKYKYLTLNVTHPCSEDWNNMHPQGRGRFCDSCQKKVIDFTLFSDVQLTQFFASKSDDVCGRFSSSQLNRSIELPSSPKRLQTLKMAGALAAGLMLSSVPLPAQQQAITTEQVQLIHSKEKSNNSTTDKIITGQILDQNGETLMFASVALMQDSLMIHGTTSDIDGYFTLKTALSTTALKLQISYIGYETQELDILDNAQPLVINMKTSSTSLPTIEVTEYFPPLVSIGVAVQGMVMRQKTEQKPISEIEVISDPDPFLPYPNPFKDQFQVKVILEQANTLLFHLYNSNGQLIHAESQRLLAGEQSAPLSERVSHLAAGTYFLRISDEERELAVRKVLKVR